MLTWSKSTVSAAIREKKKISVLDFEVNERKYKLIKSAEKKELQDKNCRLRKRWKRDRESERKKLEKRKL